MCVYVCACAYACWPTFSLCPPYLAAARFLGKMARKWSMSEAVLLHFSLVLTPVSHSSALHSVSDSAMRSLVLSLLRFYAHAKWPFQCFERRDGRIMEKTSLAQQSVEQTRMHRDKFTRCTGPRTSGGPAPLKFTILIYIFSFFFTLRLASTLHITIHSLLRLLMCL